MTSSTRGYLTVVFAEHPLGPVEPILVMATDAAGRNAVAMHRASELRAAPVVDAIREIRDSGAVFDDKWRATIGDVGPHLKAATRDVVFDGSLEAGAVRAYERLILQASIPTVDVIGVPWDSSAQRTRPPIGSLDADIPSELATMHATEQPENAYPGFYTYLAAPSAVGGIGDPILVVVGTDNGRTLAVGRRGQESRGDTFWEFINRTRTLRLNDAPTRGDDGPYTRAWVARLAWELRADYRIAPLQSIWVRDGRTEATALMHSLVERQPTTITVGPFETPGVG